MPAEFMSHIKIGKLGLWDWKPGFKQLPRKKKVAVDLGIYILSISWQKFAGILDVKSMDLSRLERCHRCMELYPWDERYIYPHVP